MTAPINLSASDRLGPNGSAQDASGLVPDARCRRDHQRERALTAERKARALAELVEPPLDDGTPQAFTRGYERARAQGIDPLEMGDAAHECSGCLRVPLEGCVCVPAREEKAA